jgi:hypothetical protein
MLTDASEVGNRNAVDFPICPRVMPCWFINPKPKLELRPGKLQRHSAWSRRILFCKKISFRWLLSAQRIL